MFGLAGFVLPSEEVRGFGTWFFQRKCQLLEFEITRSGKHPALWEKKGAGLYTAANVTKYVELRKLTSRLFNKINSLGGFVFYVGVRKNTAPGSHNSNRPCAGVRSRRSSANTPSKVRRGELERTITEGLEQTRGYLDRCGAESAT